MKYHLSTTLASMFILAGCGANTTQENENQTQIEKPTLSKTLGSTNPASTQAQESQSEDTPSENIVSAERDLSKTNNRHQTDVTAPTQENDSSTTEKEVSKGKSHNNASQAQAISEISTGKIEQETLENENSPCKVYNPITGGCED